MTPIIDIRFPIVDYRPVPIDHAYPLLSALSRIAPIIHEHPKIGIHLIRGIAGEDGTIEAGSSSPTITIRAPAESLPQLLPLAGERISVANIPIRLGTPHVHALTPHQGLFSRIVSIKGYMEPDSFQEGVNRQLVALSLNQQPVVMIGRRRVLRIRDRTIVGFAVHLTELNGEDSIRVQAEGLGGRRHFGCGVFVAANPNFSTPIRPTEESTDVPTQNR